MIGKQKIRLMDVFLFGPLIIYGGFKLGIRSWLGIALVIIGIGTIVYNGNEYLKNK